MRALVLVALVAACTHHPAPAPEPVTAMPESSRPSPPPTPPSCPAAYAGLEKTACTAEQTCSFPEGSCVCSNAMPCTGNVNAWNEAKNHPHLVWGCVEKVRADGCPGAQPNRGWPCAKEGQVCEYAACISRTLSCHAGKWQLDKQGEPPP